MKVFIIAALTADGFIGRDEHQISMEWRSKEDGQSFMRLTKQAGVMVMGSKTFQTFRIKRVPPERRLIVYTRHPENITTEGVELTNEDPHSLVARLKKEGAAGLAVCGGAMINKLFLDSGVVDEIYLTIEPRLFGKGVTLFNDTEDVSLSLLNVEHLNKDTLLLHYSVNK